MTALHRAAVLGSPIGHSLSPALYRAGFAAAGLADWSFDAIDCDGPGLAPLIAGMDEQWAGLAVTMPGKEAAAAAADQRSARVAALRVANTLIHRGGSWYADNTDVDGVIGALREARIPPGGTVLLLGGGGTARAVIAAAAELRWDGELLLAGRRPASTAAASRLAAELGVTARQIGFSVSEITQVTAGLALAICTVPAGAADHLAGALAAVPALFDVIYHPWPTALAAAGAAGRTTVTGLDMLLHQALVQFELITGVPAPAAALREALRAAAGPDLPL